MSSPRATGREQSSSCRVSKRSKGDAGCRFEGVLTSSMPIQRVVRGVAACHPVVSTETRMESFSSATSQVEGAAGRVMGGAGSASRPEHALIAMHTMAHTEAPHGRTMVSTARMFVGVKRPSSPAGACHKMRA